MTGHTLTDKTGKLTGIMCVTGEEDLLVIAEGGVMIRTGVDTIRVCGRASQGVRIMRLAEDDRVISITRAEREEEDSAEISDDAVTDATENPETEEVSIETETEQVTE